jgi:hypothetical protein
MEGDTASEREKRSSQMTTKYHFEIWRHGASIARLGETYGTGPSTLEALRSLYRRVPYDQRAIVARAGKDIGWFVEWWDSLGRDR